MAATVCAPSRPLDSEAATNELVSLLQESSLLVQEAEFHPVLYEALAALHDYIGSHQQRLVPHNHASSPWSSQHQQHRPSRPYFSKQSDLTSEHDDNVVAFGWLELMNKPSHHDSRSMGVSWEPVLLLLVVPTPEDDDEEDEVPHLRIARETGCHPLEILHTIPLPNNKNDASTSTPIVQYRDMYGDPRIVLQLEPNNSNRDNKMALQLQLRCDDPTAAMAWVSELQCYGTGQTNNPNGPHSADKNARSSPRLAALSNDASIPFDELTDDGVMMHQSVEVEMDDNDTYIVHDEVMTIKDTAATKTNGKDSSVGDNGKSAPEEPKVKNEKEDAKKQAAATKNSPMRYHHQVRSVAQTPKQQTTKKQEAEEKLQELEETPSQNAALQQKPTHKPMQQPATPQQTPQKSSSVSVQGVKSPPTTATSPTPSFGTTKATNNASIANLAPPELRVEQQKKWAAERRRQDLELQRKLARVEQRRKDLESKHKFLEIEQRKQELKANVAAQRLATTSNNASKNNDAAVQLKLINTQMAALEEEIKQKRAEAKEIKAEIEKRKREPIPQSMMDATQPSSEDAAAALQKRLSDQSRKEQALEAQKKAAAEQRRQELEERRRRAREEQKRKEEAKKQRFLEQEMRKQKLMEEAKAGGGKTNASAVDSDLLRKMSKEMSALDAEVERQRSDEAKNEEQEKAAAEEEKEEDPESARRRIAERARQREVEQDLLNNNSSSHIPMNFDPLQEGTTPMSPYIYSQEPLSPSPYTQQQTSQSNTPQPSPLPKQYTQGQSPYKHGQNQNSQSTTPQPSPLPTQYLQGQKQKAQSTTPQSSPLPPQHKHDPTSPPQQYHNSTHQRAHPANTPAPNNSHHPAPPSSHPPTERDQKYTKMAETNGDDDDSSNNTELKKRILVQWALQPPYMQSLRPIDQLLRTIQNAFPPLNGLAAHPYFDGWQPLLDSDLLGDGTTCIDEKKLSKAVRKLRFFLHPDKLPRDLSDEHQFMCKLLWDVTNDAWEDYEKAAEELDWMK